MSSCEEPQRLQWLITSHGVVTALPLTFLGLDPSSRVFCFVLFVFDRFSMMTSNQENHYIGCCFNFIEVLAFIKFHLIGLSWATLPSWAPCWDNLELRFCSVRISYFCGGGRFQWHGAKEAFPTRGCVDWGRSDSAAGGRWGGPFFRTQPRTCHLVAQVHQKEHAASLTERQGHPFR